MFVHRRRFLTDGNSETAITASLIRFSSQPAVRFIEAMPSLSSRHHLTASLSTCNSGDHVTFVSLNPSSDSLILHRGTIIGSFVDKTADATNINMHGVEINAYCPHF